MKRLNYHTLQEIESTDYRLEQAPERILQFGEGNFLRAFADHFIDIANETISYHSKVVVVQPIAQGLTEEINAQEGLYTLYLQGNQNGEKRRDRRLISCISRSINPYKDTDTYLELAKSKDLELIISNTTEAGIVFDPENRLEDRPAASFPGKLTQLLFERFCCGLPGLVHIACELIDENGAELRSCVLQYAQHWNLGDSFKHWIQTENTFCSSLVDRIVTGYPKSEAEEFAQANGYEDLLLTTGELFGLWVIEGDATVAEKLPFAKAGLPVQVVADCKPYKMRKVRILNGAHTSMVLAAFLAGKNIVRECMDDANISSYLQKTIFEEIIPTIDMDQSELQEFAESVGERFANPYIDHSLLAIALNSTSKWRARVLPSLKDYQQKMKTLPQRLVFSFAAYIAFYHLGVLENGKMRASSLGREFLIADDLPVLEWFEQKRTASPQELAKICRVSAFWGEDLSAISGFESAVVKYLSRIINGEIGQLLEELS